MIYKSLGLLMMFVLMMGTGKTFAQEESCNCACDCITEIELAVSDVMETSGCAGMMWEAPHALEVHLKKLQNWCGPQDKPLKSKIPNIAEGMLETIEDAFTGESYVDPLTGETIWIQMPAPECAWDALNSLQWILENGCAAE